MNVLDRLIGALSPAWALKRIHARSVLKRTYSGAEATRLNNSRLPKNRAADNELMGPFGADAMRAWARSLVRDNAYAWNIVDTIVSNVVGSGIDAQSVLETPEGDDVEPVNDFRDATWAEWCETCDINGELTFKEIQALAVRELVEAGEVLIRFVRTSSKEYQGIRRPVPLALEMIEADRLASDKDSYAVRNALPNNNRVIRGIELDDKGKPVAYWIYPEHPNSPYITRNQTPERIIAKDILHIYRKDRVGQSRGISWFAPVMAVNRDLGIYIENELQASAVSSCFSVAIKTETPIGSLSSPDGESNSDSAGNSFDYLEPAMVVRLRPGESVESIDPGRPNSGSEPWINLMLRGMAAGTGTSFEAISKNFSQTSYSSSRTSKLEDRPRYKRWQNLVIDDLCQPVWDEFCNAAALAGLDGFPSSMELLDGRRRVAPVDWQTPEWEWVDPTSEQNAASDAINKYMSTYQDELGSRGRSWRATYYQAAKERKLRLKLGLLTPEEKTAQMMAAQTQNSQPTASAEAAPNVASQALNGAQVTSLVNVITQVGTGAMPKETAIPVLKASFPSLSEELITAIIAPITPGSVSADGVPVAAPDASTEQASGSSGEWMGLSRLQFNRNRKALTDILNGLKDGSMSSVLAETQLAMIGVSQDNIQKIIADAGDGKIDSPIPAEV